MLTLGIPIMPRVSIAQRAFQIAYTARVRRRALAALTRNLEGLSASDLAAALRVSSRGVDQFIRDMPEVEKSHSGRCTWYRLKPADSGYSSPPAPNA